MAANKCVIVLAPNGRRQNVKVTPNTTILQILEEVCKKHGYNSDSYDLKHFNNVLDPNAMLRFTGLANNAQLEMVPCTKVRATSNVMIGIQLESGERLTGEFTPNSTLIEILQRVCPNQSLDRAVLIYMHREVHGKDNLETTTLKSLGLNSGRAILRLIHRDPEQLKTQAHVAAPLTPKLSRINDISAPGTSNSDFKKESSSGYCSNKITGPLTLLKNAKMDQESESSQSVNTEGKSKKEIRTDDLKENYEDISEGSEKKQNCVTHEQILTDRGTHCETNETYRMEFLEGRNALIFNQAGIQALPRDELPDNFYDLTVDDAKVLLRDAKRRREELEEAPLLTNAQRQFEKEKWILNQLHKYRRTVIRIQFPDQFVLQGLFGPLDTVQTVKDFIKEYLVDPDSEFVIYTTPPKYILKPNARLLDENLVPSAILHYSGSSILKPEVKEKLTDPKDAETQAAKIRMAMMRQEDEDSDEGKATNNAQNSNINYGTSNRADKSFSKNQNKTPKWFTQSHK